MQEEELQLKDQIRDLIRAKKFDELETVWLEIVESPKRTRTFHEAVARYLYNKKELDRLQEMYTLLITSRINQGQQDQALSLAEMLLDFDPAQEWLRPHILDAIEGLYADHDPERIKDYLRISGLSEETPNLEKSLDAFEDLVGASRGRVFQHGQWGLGVVKELNPREGWAILDFPKKTGHRMTIEGIKNYLRRVPKDHINARIATDTDGLKEEMTADPAAILRQTLKSYGGKMKAQDLKKVFMPTLLTDAEYKRWWAKAKDALRLDPYIDASGTGANQTLTLRATPRSFVDEIIDRFLSAKNVGDRRAILRDVRRHGDKAEMTEEDVNALHQLFLQPVNAGALDTPAERLGHGLLFEEFSDLFPDGADNPVNVEEILSHPENHPGRMIVEIGVIELQQLALRHALRLREAEAEGIVADVYFDSDPKLVTWMERELAEMGMTSVLEHCTERILSHPERNPEVFVAAAKKLIDGKLPHAADSFPPLSICQLGASLLDDFEERSRNGSEAEKKAASLTAGRLRSLLQEKQNAYLKKAVKLSTEEECRRFLAHIGMLGSLTNQLRTSMQEVIYNQRPELRRLSKSEVEEEARERESVYAFAATVDRKRGDLSHILNVEIPENSKAIGAAASLGDLKENAEYHAAKDRQKLLMSTAKELKNLLDKVRIIDLSQVKPDQVRFGTRVTLKRVADGGEETYTIVGMWEANVDRGFISHLTPFGSQLMNRLPSERFAVTLPDGTRTEYEVANIEVADIAEATAAKSPG